MSFAPSTTAHPGYNTRMSERNTRVLRWWRPEEMPPDLPPGTYAVKEQRPRARKALDGWVALPMSEAKLASVRDGSWRGLNGLRCAGICGPMAPPPWDGE